MDLSQVIQHAQAQGLPPDGFLLVADTARQELHVLKGGRQQGVFPISTSRQGTGNRDGSHQTPPGLHRVAERIGEQAACGTVFKSRDPTGEILAPDQCSGVGNTDRILTRILWLEGLEPGINSGEGIDSHQRYIYLHGTNQEHLLGQPASLGCIRMANEDIIALFSLIEGKETWCWAGEVSGP